VGVDPNKEAVLVQSRLLGRCSHGTRLALARKLASYGAG